MMRLKRRKQMGMRLHASRGSMSLGESKGGFPPDSVVDSEEDILKDSQRLIQQFHQGQPGSRCANCFGALFTIQRYG